MISVFIGLGSNLGDRKKNIENALEKISVQDGIGLICASSLYETEPVGFEDQGWFLNQVVHINTVHPPLNLLKIFQGIEKGLGRKPGIKWGPRLIDIDILLYEGIVIDTPLLTLPHPELPHRRFVLIPLAEIAPYLIHPVLKKDIREILSDNTMKNQVRKTKG